MIRKPENVPYMKRLRIFCLKLRIFCFKKAMGQEGHNHPWHGEKVEQEFCPS